MWTYERMLQYPVKIKNPNPSLAKIIISQVGGPDGELRYRGNWHCGGGYETVLWRGALNTDDFSVSDSVSDLLKCKEKILDSAVPFMYDSKGDSNG